MKRATSGGTVGADTLFSYDAPEGTISRHTFSGGSLTLAVYSPNDGALDMPDLSEVGMQFASGVNYNWQVTALGPFATIDEALGPKGNAGDSATFYTLTGTNRGFHYEP